MTAHTPDALASALPTGKYVVAPAPTGYRGTALWTVTADGDLKDVVATEPQDHGPGSTAAADLSDALAVYRAACAVLAPDEATVDLVAQEIRRQRHLQLTSGEPQLSWLAAEPETTGRYREQARAILAALTDMSAQARHTADDTTGGCGDG